MKVTVIKSPNQEIEKGMLVCHNLGDRIILVTDAKVDSTTFSGITLQQGGFDYGNEHPVGSICNRWDKCSFKIFTGTITLSND